ncbi:putative ORFan [Tupanvirus deep ocean]|uniref:ORFan n=2 Tax=Tupanvirus TaxID=2094720 RepID=A0AC62A8K9_9VIRU|nr:putative ORFan [Tupanvirus deep ocean]QKU34082.1 putative ORFan [Tupanvirus deep ocean]
MTDTGIICDRSFPITETRYLDNGKFETKYLYTSYCTGKLILVDEEYLICNNCGCADIIMNFLPEPRT